MSFDPLSASDEDSDREDPTPCCDAPHCKDFDEQYPLGQVTGKKRKKTITEDKRIEYKL
jgi:hypothetical protein